MATDEDLGITGKDVRWEILVNGVPVPVAASVRSFTARARYDQVINRHLGTNDEDIDHIPIGWEGDLEITDKNGALEAAIDAYNRARRERIPVEIVIHETRFYRNRSTRTHTYRCCQLNFESSGSRGESVVHQVSWISGRDRV